MFIDHQYTRIQLFNQSENRINIHRDTAMLTEEEHIVFLIFSLIIYPQNILLTRHLTNIYR